MLRTFKQLTLEERERLYLWRNQGISFREIGRRLNRDHAGLSKEWKRNRWRGSEYLPVKAQVRAEKKGREQRRKAPLKNMHIWLYVQEHLRKPYYWTPEQIAGRLSVEYPSLSIHHETIYRYIYSEKAKHYKLWQYLPRRRKKRMKKGERKVYAAKIVGIVPIDERPKAVEERKEIGHWETDNSKAIFDLVGKKTDRTAVSVTVERVLKITLLAKARKTAEGKTEAVTRQLIRLPEHLRKTLTTDNGVENAKHKEITEHLSMPVYFCHAYHSWEKGTVENTNGRIRRFIPKKLSIDEVPEERLKAIEDWLNNSPRKCLNFLTPYEKMQQVLKSSNLP